MKGAVVFLSVFIFILSYDWKLLHVELIVSIQCSCNFKE